MMHIDLSNVKIDDNWDKKSKEYTDELYNADNEEERGRIIKKYESHWSKVKEQLKSASYRKCWYSESINPYSHLHVDHFRPKKFAIDFDGKRFDGYWWLTFEISNYRLAGSVGNQKKGNHFAVKANRATWDSCIEDEIFYLLDPLSVEDVVLLNFRPDGTAVESAPEQIEPWNYQRASYTIEKLDLNYPDLVEERKSKWQEVNLLIKKCNLLNEKMNQTPSASNKTKIDSCKNEIRKMLRPSAEFTSTAKACLRACGEKWAFRLLEENITEEQFNTID